mmetsp:Transcript_11410/g.38914  ORF Transcript_11410/g.38914 Transcript_11410/m.38914 type:complete len:440 (+) Transcript_11410:277-1596(+)
MLAHGVEAGGERAHNGVACLVVGDQALALGGRHPGALLHAHGDTVEGVLDLAHGDLLLLPARRDDGRLVEQVGEARAAHAGGARSDSIELHVRSERLVTRVHLEDGQAALAVGEVHGHAAVEAARAEERRVEHVGTVGGRDDHDARVLLEAVHLSQDLVERLLALVVAAKLAAARAGALPADGVDLVDEDDARSVLLRLREDVAHARGAHAHEHLHELGARRGDEGRARLARHGAREQRLACPRGPFHDDAARDLGAHLGELGRVLEELDHLRELELGGVAAGHVVEDDARLRLELHLGPGLAHLEGVHPAAAARAATRAAAHAAAREQRQTAEEEDGHDEGREDGEEGVRLLRGQHGEPHVVLAEQVDEVHRLPGEHGHLLAVALRVDREQRVAVGGEGDDVNLVLVHFLEELAIRQGAAALGGGGRLGERQGAGRGR